MDYILHPRPAPEPAAPKPRLITSRPSRNLRRGGGRKDSPGWTEQKRRTNRRRFNKLRPFIKTGATIVFPSSATPEQLKALNACSLNFCREQHLPARCVWEGPGFHQHVALGIEYDAVVERRWLKRLSRRWLQVFGVPMGPDAFLWKPQVEPDRIASYLLKTRGKNGLMVKGLFAWLSFTPTWETGFRRLAKGQNAPPEPVKPRKKCVDEAAAPKPHHAISPTYTVRPEQTSGKLRETCQICWHRWGQDLWQGFCRCNPAFPNC